MSAPSEALNDSRSGLLRWAVAGSVLVWLAFPPVGWSYLAWLGPVLWLRWIGAADLPGSRPYGVLWLAGLVFWLLAVHWIRLPHPLNYIAWISLAAYLGAYLPVFVALSRVGVKNCGLPLWLVAPVVWTGLDWLRGHLMTGFLMGSLAHTQVGLPVMIQIADLGGEYVVTFLIVLVAAGITQVMVDHALVLRGQWRPLLALLPGFVAIVAAIVYGHMQSVDIGLRQKGASGPRVALIQGHTRADWKYNPDRKRTIMEEHRRLSLEAVRDAQDHPVDLIIWPETAFREALATVEEGYQVPPHIDPDNLIVATNKLAELARQLNAGLLVGIEHYHLSGAANGRPQVAVFNSSALVDRQGMVRGTYDKMHRVLLGEYVSFSDWLPFLDQLTPITGAIDPGKRPVAMQLDNVVYATNICYETVVPHLIRRHVVELTNAGKTPDVLVNLTNDAWFWGSSELDMHLACGVFRAVEMRRPMVIAANGGLSAHINPYGTVVQKTPRQQTATLLVDLKIPARAGSRQHNNPYPSAYAAYGDWFAIACVVCCVALAAQPFCRAKRGAPPAALYGSPAKEPSA